MNQSCPLSISLCGARLDFVPALHYRVAFAQAINRIARDPERRPDAIAVELGPGITFAAAKWLRELDIGPTRLTRLPVLLGQKQQQRLLAPELRARAIALQTESGRPLES